MEEKRQGFFLQEHRPRRSTQAAEGTRLESEQTGEPVQGFKSLLLRHFSRDLSPFVLRAGFYFT